MGLSEAAQRQQMVEVGRLLHQKEWVAANDGNLSVRLSPDRILCTPTAMSKGMMQPEDLLIVDEQGHKVAGERERTSEIAMHLTIYALRPDVQAVVHAHPPVATGFAVAGRPLNLALLPEVIVGLGCVPLAPYGLPGTPALCETLRPLVPRYEAILMQNHGAVSYGDSLLQAYFRMETVEHVARITLVAELLGGARPLPQPEVDALLHARARYGVSTRHEPQPDCPQAATHEAG